MENSKCAIQNDRPGRYRKSYEKQKKGQKGPPTQNVNDSHPTLEKARKPGIVPFVSVFSRFLQKNAPKSRCHLFVDDEENSKTGMNELEELLLINSSVIDVYLQVYGDAGSGRSLYLHF